MLTRLKLWVLALPFVVAACTGGPISESPLRVGASKAVLETIAVAKGEIVVGGPSHYCIDKKGSRLSGGAAFVLLASCASLSGDTSLLFPNPSALLTASVERRTSESPNASDLLELITSSQGRAVLARDGRADSVSIVTSLRDGDSVLLQIDDQSPGATPGLETTYWRGLFTLNGRLITTSVVGFESRPLSAASGLATLKSFEKRIREESPNIASSEISNTWKDNRNGLFRNLLR